MESSKNWFRISKNSLIYIFLCTTLFCIIQDYEITRVESFLLLMIGGAYIAFLHFDSSNNEYEGDQTKCNPTEYALAIQEVQKFTENELGDGRFRIKPDITEWKVQRSRTIATLSRLKAYLDDVSIYANCGRGVGIITELGGVILSFIGGAMETRGSSSTQALMEYGDILAFAGPIMQEASNVVEHSISRSFLLEVAEVLRRDQQLSRPLQEWLTFSRNLNANIRAIFGCDINSPNLRTVLNVFSDFMQNFNSRTRFRRYIDRGGVVPSESLSRLRSQLERNPELQGKVQEICSTLNRSTADLAIRDTSEGIRLQRNFFGESRDNDRIGSTSRNAPEHSNAVLAFQAVHGAVMFFHLRTVITNLREGRSRNSEALQSIINSLTLELRNVEAMLTPDV